MKNLISNFIASSVVFIGKEIYDKHIKNPATRFDIVDIKIGGLGWFIGWITAGVLFAPMWYLVNFLKI